MKTCIHKNKKPRNFVNWIQLYDHFRKLGLIKLHLGLADTGIHINSNIQFSEIDSISNIKDIYEFDLQILESMCFRELQQWRPDYALTQNAERNFYSFNTSPADRQTDPIFKLLYYLSKNKK